jgi:hypothetical protein
MVLVVLLYDLFLGVSLVELPETPVMGAGSGAWSSDCSNSGLNAGHTTEETGGDWSLDLNQ